MASGKTFGGWLSGDLLKKAQARVDRDYSGNVSEYVVDLIKDDVELQEPMNLAPDEHTDQLLKLSKVAKQTGLDPVSIMRATLAAIVSHAEANGGRIVFPITLAQQSNEVDLGADVWSHLAQSDRDALLEHALRGDSWPQVLDAMKQETAPRLKDLRLAYIFATSASSRETLALAVERPAAANISSTASADAALLAEKKRRAAQAAKSFGVSKRKLFVEKNHPKVPEA